MKKFAICVAFLCSLFSIITKTNAQPCATLQVTGPPSGTIPCDSALNLSANITFPSGINNTDVYSQGAIPFNPMPWVGPNTILANIDDVWSGVVPLPFPFCFFGNTYTSMIVSSNGQIGFDLSQASGGNAWATTTWGPAPVNNVTFNNTIMSPHHDILPTNTGALITWGVFGTAPCRTMVVSWTNCDMYSCTTLIDTQQVVLYELTNIIDINIKNKPLCATWNGGLAYEGIQNANGTVAYMTPGRNGTQWTANDDSYRFIPNGASTPITYSFVWTDVNTGAVLGTGQNLNLQAPVTTTDISCCVNVTGGCAPYSFCDTFHVGISKVNADFSYKKHYGCDEDTVKFFNLTTPSQNTTYSWFFGDGGVSTSKNPSHIYANQGTYTVRLISDHPPCIKDTEDKVIIISHPIKASFVAVGVNGKDSICLGDYISATSTSTVAAALSTYSYYWGDGTDTTVSNANAVQHVYASPGTYTIKHIIKDTLGCTDSTFQNAFVDNPPFEAFTISHDNVCVGESVNFKDTLSPYVQWFEWNFGDGKRLKNIHNPTHTWDTPLTSYDVFLIGHYLICHDDSVKKTVTVNAYPIVSLGPDTMMCPGITGSITLSDINNSSALYTWSNGETSNAITVTEPGHYWVKASNGECATIDSIWIKRDCYINIPNSFSPNGDGLNDYFLPRELLSSGVKSFVMNIYNRWGENIFKATALDGRGWDGKFNGVPQPLGSFVYVIDVTFNNGLKKNYTGNVTLLR